MFRRKKFGAIVAQWPVVIVATGLALTVIWIALLIWLPLRLIALQ
jgi:hypothetical protein